MQSQNPMLKWNYLRIGYIGYIVPLALVLLSGCADGPLKPELAPVKGIVLLDGKPIEGCVVEFLQKGSPTRSMGFTDESGRFELTSFAPGDGASVGTNQVTVTKRTKPTHSASVAAESVSLDTISDPDERRLASMKNNVAEKSAAASDKVRRDLLPPKYASAETTDLKYEVTAVGPNDFQIILTD